MTPFLLTPDEVAQVRVLHATYPYRIVYVARNPATGESLVSAVLTMRIPNKLTREGWQVVVVK